MKRQRGQTMIEFALMFPFMALFIFGMIYGGAMFMEYLNFSNNARQIAREISVLDNIENRDKIIKSYSEDGKEGEKTFASFYTAKREIFYTYEQQEKKDKEGNVVIENGETVYEDNKNKPVDVVVTVTFTRNNEDLPWILYKIGFPPQTINPIVYRMRLEQKPTDDTSSDS